MEQLIEVFKQLNIPWDKQILDQFQSYMDGVLEWNTKVNLTAITKHDEFIKKHFVDSLLCYGLKQMTEAKTVIDVGTGAGFPGIPLAIVYPDKEFLLMDSLNKRIKIIAELIDNVGLKNVKTLHGRAEEVARKKEHREQYDLCVSRAVAKLSVLSEYCLPFVRVDGFFAAYKTEKIEPEIEESLPAISMLGGAIEEQRSQYINGFDLEHQIILIKKERPTLAKYPRKAGTPEKVPLK